MDVAVGLKALEVPGEVALDDDATPGRRLDGGVHLGRADFRRRSLQLGQDFVGWEGPHKAEE